MHHLTLCLSINGKRVGFVLSGPYLTELERVAHLFDAFDTEHPKEVTRVGYVGGDSFEIATTRAGMMQRNERGSWGPL